MPGPCAPEFARLARWLGDFGCDTAQPVIQLRAPHELTNWTLAIVELLMVGGAAYALLHASRRWRRQGDPMPLGLWIASVVYLLLLEPTVYFPAELGVPGQHEVVFVHNVFMVQLMYDRLPLYIVALYPAMLMLAYEVVRAHEVFGRRGALVGAVGVGAVHHAFYEVFDHLGPQLRWWVWAPTARANHLMFESVPLTSNVLFALIGPILLVLLVHRLLARGAKEPAALRSASLLARSFGAGALMLPVLGILGAPWIAAVAAADADVGPLLSMGFAGLALLGTAWMVLDARRAGPRSADADIVRYVEVHGWGYLSTFAVLWSLALPDYVRASGGVTADGTPIGSLAYAAACFFACGALLVTAARRRPTSAHAQRPRPNPLPSTAPAEAESLTALQVRRVPFTFEGVPFQWNAELPRFGLLMNAVGIMAIAFEKYIVSAVRQAIPRITDPVVAAEADAFLRQEAQHAASHRLHIRALAREHPGVTDVLDAAIAEYDALLEAHPLDFHLAYIADLEATFTPVFKLWLDHHDTLFRSGDERVASLFLWHFVEEVEHRSSALVIYDHLVDSPWYRARIAPKTFRHVAEVYGKILEGFEEHVPLAARRVDTRDRTASRIWRREFSARLSGLLRTHETVDAGLFPGASAGELARTVHRLIASQMPGHDPAYQPLPAFADRWFATFERGGDVARWYSSQESADAAPPRVRRGVAEA